MSKVKNKIFNINNLVNANAIEMVDGSKWIMWSLARLKDGLTLDRVNIIAHILDEQ